MDFNILQPQLFDAGDFFKPPFRIGNEDQEEPGFNALEDYGGESGAHLTPMSQWEPNPLPRPKTHIPWTKPESSSEEFIPTERVTSTQPRINPGAVDHMVQHANPLELATDPVVTAYEEGGSEHYYVRDGNHRVNAAARRGQLFLPAVVQRLPSN